MFEVWVVFDLDDTLYLEREYVRSGFEQVGKYALEKLGIRNFASSAWDLFLAGQRGRIFNKVFQDQKIPCEEGTIESLVDVYRSHIPRISLLPDALLCLNTLRGSARLALISDGPLAAQRNKVAALQLDRWFSPIVLTEEFGENYRKPSPSAFQMLQKQSGLAPDHFYYVADNPFKDFLTPRSLGWKTVRIRREAGLYAAVELNGDHSADLELSNLTEIPCLIQQSESWSREAFKCFISGRQNFQRDPHLLK